MTTTGIRTLDPPLMLGDAAFDRFHYYERGDVLYLRSGLPQPAADADESVEGDTVFFDAHGRVIGLTMIGPRFMLERDGTLNVTLPRRGIATRWPRPVAEPLLVETLASG